MKAGFSASPRQTAFAAMTCISGPPWVPGKIALSMVPYADVVTTTTHKTLRGPRGGMILCREA